MEKEKQVFVSFYMKNPEQTDVARPHVFKRSGCISAARQLYAQLLVPRIAVYSGGLSTAQRRGRAIPK